MRNNGVVSGFARKFDRVNGFGDAADLIELDENRVGNAFLDAAGEAFGVGDEEVVADELNFLLGRFCADRIGERFPSGPIVFGHAVFDGDDGIFFNPVGPVSGHLLGRLFGFVRLFENIFSR